MKGIKDLPNNFTYGRVFRVKLKQRNLSLSFLNVSFLNYGLKSLEIGKLCSNHLKVIMKVYKKMLKTISKLKFNFSMLLPVTKKPLEIRMGKGKGARSHWEFNVLCGMVLFELSGTKFSFNNIFMCLNIIKKKLPVRCKIVKLIF